MATPLAPSNNSSNWLDGILKIVTATGPLLIGIAGLIFSVTSQSRDAKLKTADLAMKVIESRSADNLPDLRNWAIETLSETAGVAGRPLPANAQVQLKQFRVTIASPAVPIIGPANGVYLSLAISPASNDIVTAPTIDELRRRTGVSLLPHSWAGNPVARVPNGIYGFTEPNQLVKPDKALLQADSHQRGFYKVEVHKTQTAGIFIIGYARRTEIGKDHIELFPSQSSLQSAESVAVAVPAGLITNAVSGVFSGA